MTEIDFRPAELFCQITKIRSLCRARKMQWQMGSDPLAMRRKRRRRFWWKNKCLTTDRPPGIGGEWDRSQRLSWGKSLLHFCLPIRADWKSQVRDCLDFCTAEFLSLFAYESAEQKPNHCPTWDILLLCYLSRSITINPRTNRLPDDRQTFGPTNGCVKIVLRT